MLPNDPRLALFQANATMAERQHEAAQERLVAPNSPSGHPGTLRARRDPSGWFRGLTDRVRTALGGQGGHTRASGADEIS
jgi:hypothetical protein